MSEQRRPIKRDSYGQLVNRDDYPEELDLLIYVESIEHMPIAVLISPYPPNYRLEESSADKSQYSSVHLRCPF